jgi:predicted oxidoreductase
LHDLQTDYLDVLLLHRPSPLLEVNEVAWVLQHPLISSVVVGTSKLERVQEMCRALDVRLSIQDYFFLWEAARGIKVP